MPREFLIIDGYNLLHAAGMARRRYGPGDLERCRGRLLNFLKRHLETAERRDAQIVFDAGKAPGDARRQATEYGMSVLYSDPGEDADTVIEELIRHHSAPRQVIVISSDHRLQRAAKRRRTGFLDSEDFVDKLRRRGTVDDIAEPNRPDDEAETPEIDTQEWLDIFGEIPEAAELNRLSPDENLNSELQNELRPDPTSADDDREAPGTV